PPAAFALVPPQATPFSSKIASTPRAAACTTVAKPAIPPPTTTTSAPRSQSSSSVSRVTGAMSGSHRGQPARRELGALCECFELSRGGGGGAGGDEAALREAAAGAAHPRPRPDTLGQPDEPLGHQLRMLDHVRVVGDHTGDQDLALRQLDVLPQ